jgi:hypothetical protein
MHRFVWLILAFVILAVGAPYASADAFTYSYAFTSIIGYDATFTIESIPAPLSATTIPASEVAAYSLTGPGWGENAIFNGITLNLYGVGDTGINFDSFFVFQVGDEFAQADYTTPGTYMGNFGTMTVTETSAAMPEPRAFALTLSGLLGLLFMRRFSQNAFAYGRGKPKEIMLLSCSNPATK